MVSDLLAMLVVVVVTSLGPGLVLLKRLPWHPLEKLCGALGLSYLFVYLISFAAFELESRVIGALVITVASMAMFVASLGQVRRLLSHRQTRRSVVALSGLFAWYMLQQLLIRHYGGGNWWGDWFEHYQRAQFFLLHPRQLDFLFLTNVPLPARPPLMNLLVSHFLMVGKSFAAFQTLHTFFNTLVFLPSCLLARRFGSRSRAVPWVLLALFALSPYLSQNATYTWTKLFASFFCLFGTAMYLAAWRKREHTRMIAAFVSFASGLLVHYSIAPYTAFVAGHYLLVVMRHRARRWRELLSIVAVCGTLLLTWFAYSFFHYGRDLTLGSNTTIQGYESYSLRENIVNVGLHLLNSTVPFPLYDHLREDPMRTGLVPTLRETMFYLYQSNVLFAFGSLGWLCVAMLAWRKLREGPRGSGSERRFWLIYISVAVAFGMVLAPINNRGDFGAAQICLHSIIALGCALVASQYDRLSWQWRGVVVVGCCIDFLLGIWLHLHLLHAHPEVGRFVHSNWLLKHDLELHFLGDSCAVAGPWLELLLVGLALGLITMLLLIDRSARRRE